MFRTSILHRAALVKGIVPGKSLFQQVRGVAASLQRPLKVVAKTVPVNWMGTVFNNSTGALPGCETAQISEAHLGDDKVYVMLVMIDMGDHRYDAADIAVLGQRLGYEDCVGSVAGKITRAAYAVHHVCAIDVCGINVPIDVALQRRVGQISPRRRITSGWLLISCGRKIKRLLYLSMSGTTSRYLVSDTVIDEQDAKSSLPASNSSNTLS